VWSFHWLATIHHGADALKVILLPSLGQEKGAYSRNKGEELRVHCSKGHRRYCGAKKDTAGCMKYFIAWDLGRVFCFVFVLFFFNHFGIRPCVPLGTKRMSEWVSVWNENTWNDSFGAFFITCSRSGMVRIVVCASPCILLFGTEWAEWKQSCQSFNNNKMVVQGKSASVANLNSPIEQGEKNLRWVFQSIFGTIAFMLFHIPIIFIIPILPNFSSRRGQENAPLDLTNSES